MKRIAIYSRKSVETDTGESIRNQIKFCTEYFQRHGECKFEIFEDEGFSGGNIERPSFKRMMELIKLKQFDVVAVYKIDRIARNIVDFVNIFDELENFGVQLVSITEGFDPSTPAGRMMMLLLASFAEMERMNIAQRVKDNMKELAKMGRWSGGTPPKGYITEKYNENGKKVTYLKLVDTEAYYVKECFRKYSEGLSTYAISKYLKEKYNITYPEKTIYNLILNPTYLISSDESNRYLTSMGYNVFGEANGNGYLPYNRRPRMKASRDWDSKSKFVGVSKHEGIIDLPLWIKVQEVLKARSNDMIKDRVSEITYLSGLIKCKCGAAMCVNPGHSRKDGTRNYYFRCVSRRTKGSECYSKFLNIKDAESNIRELLEMLSDRDNLNAYTKNSSEVKDISKELKEINKQIKTNDQSISNLIDRLSLITVDAAATAITKKIEELSINNNKLKEELLNLERKRLFEQRDEDNINILHETINHFLYSDMDFEDRKKTIRMIVKSIVWDSDAEELKVELLT